MHQQLEALQQQLVSTTREHTVAIAAALAQMAGATGLGEGYAFSFAVSKTMRILHMGEELTVPELFARRKETWNETLSRWVASEGRGAPSMISMLTLMADVEATIRRHPDKRINSIALDSPYDAVKTMLAVMATHGLIVYVVTRSNLYVHAATVGLLKYMDGSRGFWIVHRNRVLAESHAVKGSWESSTCMGQHPFIIQGSGPWLDPCMTRYSLKGGASTGTAQIAIVRVESKKG